MNKLNTNYPVFLPRESMNKNKPIAVKTFVNAPMKRVWDCWTEPKHINGWAFASDDWEARAENNDLRVGGRFKTVMSAKNKSAGFDFTGVYTNVKEHKLIEYVIDDGRHVKVEFKQLPDGVEVVEQFEAENQNPESIQRTGWQAFLDNFKKYAEAN
jgi:uncharacterized protein YndB with AHSA1/START domain